MKKISNYTKYAIALFLAVFFSATAMELQAQTCNQVEILYKAPDCFDRDHQDPGGASGGKNCKEIAVCVNQPYTYSSSVTGGGWTYNWTVTGPTSVVINPNNTSATVNIVWPQVGIYTLTLTATDGSGNIFTYCLKVNVKDKPNANFTFTPNNVCAGSIISFTDASTFANSYMCSWNFGDPPSGGNNYTTTSALATVTHQYNSPGTYTVTLIAYSFTLAGGGGLPNEPPSIKTCCADTITKVVTIKAGSLKIECISTVCAGDTATYHTVGCATPAWTVTGGLIQSQAGDSVTVVWGNGNPQGQLQVSGCGCTTSVPVPIIPTNPIIIGNTSPCNTSVTSYSLPVLPGTFYTWTLTNITNATNYNNLLNAYPDNYTVWINWAAAPPGTYQLTINLDNKHICCSSSGSLTINPSDKWTAYYDQTICSTAPNNIANLSVFPTGGTFSWTVLPINTGVTPLTGTGPTFSPTFTLPGSYLVEVIETANTYCNSGIANPQQIKVTVISTPAPGIINGPTTACIGSNNTYTMSTNAPAGFHYEWSITGGSGCFQPGCLPNVNGNSAIIQWTALPGTISVVLAANGTPPCPSPAVTLTVTQATVGNITGTMNVCVDGNGTYTLTGGNLPPGETITWSIASPNTSLGTIISGQGTNSITILWHGQPTGGPWGPVTINASTACGNATALTGVMIYPKFTVAITTTGIDICQPGGVSLGVSGAPGGSTIVWSPATINNITTPGTYTVTVTKGGCTDVKSITIDDPFAIIPVTCGVGGCNGTATNENLGVIVVKPLAGVFTYQWYTGTYPSGTAIGGATSANYTTTTHGNFYVVVIYGTCTRYLNFTVKKVCCPDVNNPQITYVRNSCNSYTFTGTTPNPTGATITWNFGDGNTATGVSGVPITHVYATAGVYCVTFCVGPPSPNPTSCTGNCAVRTVTVPIQAAFLYTLGCNGCLNVINTSTVITSNPSYVTYFWNFGDGNTSTAQNPGPNCYANPGTYTVTLTISYNDGQVSCTSTATQTVNYVPLAISVVPSPVCTGVPTTFSIAGSPSFIIVTHTWNFGDGFTAYTPSSIHIYNAAGTFNVTLTVTDQLGNTCTANSSVTVAPGIGPCTILPGYICPGGSATLSTPNIGGYTYLWEQEITLNVFGPAPGTNTNNTYNAPAPGFYHVVITGPGPNFCKCTSNKVEVKPVPKPKAIIAVSPSSRLCGPGNIILTSVNHVTGYTSNWYANGNYGSMLSSGQMYMVFGVAVTTVYNLILINEYGCSDTCSLTVYVNPIPPQPVITSSPTLCEGVPITLTVTNYANNITWNTGSNTTSIVVYTAGVYTATYTDPVTGCSSSKNIKINKRPPTELFPHFCDKIPCTCRDSTGNFTIYAPLPLIGAFGGNYNIQWYFNNNPVGGNTPTYSPAASGTYYIMLTDPMTGCKDTSKTYTIVVPPCDTCDCKESKWGDIVLTEGENVPGKDAKANPKANVGNGQQLKCNSNYVLKCNQPYTINASYICKDSLCPPKVTYTLLPPVGLPVSGNVAATFTPTMSGVYVLTLYGWCGNKICDSCIIDLTVKCDTACDCKGSKWGEKVYTTQNGTKTFECNKTYNVKCNQPVTVNATYTCPDPNKCPANVTYVLQPPSGSPLSGNAPVTFTPNQTGTYTVTLYGWCGTAKCDSCIVKFKTDCHPVDTACCPYQIKVDTSKLTYTYNQQYNATIAGQTFTISGLAGVPLTEVRAEVLSYTITDNFNKECMKCISLPYSWASVLSAGNIGPVPPKITMYNSTVHPFNPTGAGLYQNPREVVWNNGTTFTISNGTQLGMNFILPPPPLIDCCELKGKICVKFTFRDKNCKECEVIACFEFLIKSKKPF